MSSHNEYRQFFMKSMEKFNINSPADLKSDEQKKKFFNYIDKHWKGEKNEETIHESPSPQLRNMVLEIIKDHENEGVDFDTIMTAMMKKVGIPRRNLEKLVKDCLEWWEGSGSIYATVNRRTTEKHWYSEEVGLNKNAEEHSERISEANAFLKARSVAMWEGKETFEFNGKTFPLIKVKEEK